MQCLSRSSLRAPTLSTRARAAPVLRRSVVKVANVAAIPEAPQQDRFKRNAVSARPLCGRMPIIRVVVALSDLWPE